MFYQRDKEGQCIVDGRSILSRLFQAVEYVEGMTHWPGLVDHAVL